MLCVKEIDLIGHFNKEWECLFEHFLKPPYVEGGDVKIYYKVPNEERCHNKFNDTCSKLISIQYNK